MPEASMPPRTRKSGNNRDTRNSSEFSSIECELHRDGIAKSIDSLDHKVDIEIENLSDQLDRVERNMLDAIKQANRVSELANNGHRDTLNSTLQSIHENFERGNERFRTNENSTAKVANDLNNTINEVQRTKLDLQFLVTNREGLQELISTKKSMDQAIATLEKNVAASTNKVNKQIYRLGMLFIIGYILMAVYEVSGHNIEAAWEAFIKIIF